MPQVKATWLNPATGAALDAGVHRTYSLLNFRQIRLTDFQWFRTPDFWEAAVLLEAVEER